MSQQLIEKIRKSRESTVTVGGHKFTVRRPTELEIAELDGEVTIRTYLSRFVTGWDVKGCDIYPGGDGEVPPFSADAFLEWAADKPEIWSSIIEAVNSSYAAHIAHKADELEKPDGG